MGTTTEKLQAALDSKNDVQEALEEHGLEATEEFATYGNLIRTELTARETVKNHIKDVEAHSPIMVNAASTDGIAYTATIDNLTELYAGLSLMFIPGITSASTTPTLNVNGLGAKYIRLRLSTNTATTANGLSETWLMTGNPVMLTYNGTYWVAEIALTDANNLYGTVPIKKGGTGATTRVNAFNNLAYLGVEPIKSTSDDTVAKWLELGSGYCYYATASLLNNQPEQFGILINMVGSGNLAQLFVVPSNGMTYFRGGYINSGVSTWGDSWSTKFLPLTGGDVSGEVTFNGYGKISGDSTNIGIGVFGADPSTNPYHHRDIQILSASYEPDVGKAFRTRYYRDGASHWCLLFGEHNKPIGTYAGNGSSTKRTIDTGAESSQILKLHAGGYFGIVGPNGGIFVVTGGTLSGVPSSALTYMNGILTIAGTGAQYNKSGVSYSYQCL